MAWFSLLAKGWLIAKKFNNLELTAMISNLQAISTISKVLPISLKKW